MVRPDWVGPYVFSSMTVDQSAKWVAAGRMGMFATGKYSALDADVIMGVVGINPAVSHVSIHDSHGSPDERVTRCAEPRFEADCS